MLAEELAALRASRQEGEQLRQRLDQLLRRLYGPRSERVHPDQPLLFADPPGAEAQPPAQPVEPGESAPARRRGHGRQQLPGHPPRDRRVYQLSAAERLGHSCGQARVVIGQQVSEQLDYEPASLKVVEHVRLTCTCPCCEKQRQAGHPRPPDAGTDGPPRGLPLPPRPSVSDPFIRSLRPTGPLAGPAPIGYTGWRWPSGLWDSLPRGSPCP